MRCRVIILLGTRCESVKHAPREPNRWRPKPKKNKEPRSGLERLSFYLRVITHVLQGFAGVCKCPLSKPFSLLRFAACCTVLRSRWYQIGIRNTCSKEFANSKKGISRLPLPLP